MGPSRIMGSCRHSLKVEAMVLAALVAAVVVAEKSGGALLWWEEGRGPSGADTPHQKRRSGVGDGVAEEGCWTWAAVAATLLPAERILACWNKKEDDECVEGEVLLKVVLAEMEPDMEAAYLLQEPKRDIIVCGLCCGCCVFL